MAIIGMKVQSFWGIVQLAQAALLGLVASSVTAGCGTNKVDTSVDANSTGGAPSMHDAGPQTSDASVVVGTVVVSAATRRPRTTSWSVNYWTWTPSYGNDVAGTESQVAALKPAIMRVGGYNNDANTPDPFNDAELDKSVAYARAIGAEPLIQVPLLADIDGGPASAASAAAMVNYANVTKDYHIKYFSVGNEPDLYPTQGLRSNPSQPAIANYKPSDYCAAARAYVAAMKAVDPTIKIVGPDLSWQYRPGNDWLTPILQDCGDLFDIVSIHRYPFTSKQATFDAAKGDAIAFDQDLTNVRSLIDAAGYDDKPLALMEMNVVYDATTCRLGASPTTTGSALWLADGLGTAIERGLWTSAIWDISDDNGWALGILGPPPAHTPRPEYYVYQLYAEHVGPTLLDVVQQPSDTRIYASRNQADDTTDLIAINWSTSSAPLDFQVTGLASDNVLATFTLPSLSISALEIPDYGVAKAWTYGDAQNQAKQVPIVLAPGAMAAVDAGPPHLANACSIDASVTCPKIVLPNPLITTQGTTANSDMVFGSAPYQWHSFNYAGAGQIAPTGTVTPDGKGIDIVGGFVPPVTENWAGVGMYFVNANCLDASAYTGIRFDFSGDLGGCSLSLGASFSGNQSTSNDATRGSCPGSNSVCYPPMAAVSPDTDADAGAATIKVPFSAFNGGGPNSRLDPATILTIEWQLGAPSSSKGCAANFSVENVAFY